MADTSSDAHDGVGRGAVCASRHRRARRAAKKQDKNTYSRFVLLGSARVRCAMPKCARRWFFAQLFPHSQSDVERAKCRMHCSAASVCSCSHILVFPLVYSCRFFGQKRRRAPHGAAKHCGAMSSRLVPPRRPLPPRRRSAPPTRSPGRRPPTSAPRAQCAHLYLCLCVCVIGHALCIHQFQFMSRV